MLTFELRYIFLIITFLSNVFALRVRLLVMIESLKSSKVFAYETSVQ